MSIDLNDAASLLGSRICHDLISPLGAISNGLELLAMSGISDSPEMKLIEEAVESANARVRFFRVAFGASSAAQMLARAEILRLIDGCYGTGRVKVRWQPPSDPSRTEAKTAFLALLCMESALPQGGEIAISADRGNWQLQAFGPSIRYDPDLWATLTRDIGHDVMSSQVQFILLREVLAATGQSPLVGHSDSAVSLRY
ncbi:MAG: histidine phosphotransferase family protein [Pseudomonadota bacterium]